MRWLRVSWTIFNFFALLYCSFVADLVLLRFVGIRLNLFKWINEYCIKKY